MSVLKFIFRGKTLINSLNKIQKINKRNLSADYISIGSCKVESPINALTTHYHRLKLPEHKTLATYIWVDGSGINMRSKDRVLENVEFKLPSIPKWAFDGSSTGQAMTHNSDTLLVPCALYKDPFRPGRHLIVLCETLRADGTPTCSNHRAHCAKVLSDISDKDPWFGIEQEYTIFDQDFHPLGWPKTRGVPTVKSKFSYCGVGASHVAGRNIVECHARACVYAGLDFGGSNAEVMKGSWEFQIGTTPGIKAADDLWVARYILNRVAEDFGAIISYHPKPMGADQPGIGCHHNFSVKKMRNEEGITEIERVCQVLCERHEEYMKQCGLGDGEDNKLRLTGKFETASFDKCRWAMADRGASIRLHRSIVAERKGFLEDRRPAGDCDPYRVCALLAETCKN